MLSTLDSWMSYFQFDVAMQFERPYRVERITRETLGIPGVVEAETWGFITPAGNVRMEAAAMLSLCMLPPPIPS